METFFTLLAIVRGFHWSPVNSPHKGQWRGALMFSLICAWINVWVNNGEAGDVRRHRAHYDVIVMYFCIRTRLSGHLPWFNEFCSFTKTRHLWNSRAELFENTFLYARLKNGTYYAVAMSVRPSVRLSVCPSVRPSVRPRFPDFSSTCFEISIWNLVYAFSRWHMSSLSCITIGSIWPSLQPKVGQTYFLQSWPHKSR